MTNFIIYDFSKTVAPHIMSGKVHIFLSETFGEKINLTVVLYPGLLDP